MGGLWRLLARLIGEDAAVPHLQLVVGKRILALQHCHGGGLVTDDLGPYLEPAVRLVGIADLHGRAGGKTGRRLDRAHAYLTARLRAFAFPLDHADDDVALAGFLD